jgi:hypothetical protein
MCCNSCVHSCTCVALFHARLQVLVSCTVLVSQLRCMQLLLLTLACLLLLLLVTGAAGTAAAAAPK